MDASQTLASVPSTNNVSASKKGAQRVIAGLVVHSSDESSSRAKKVEC